MSPDEQPYKEGHDGYAANGGHKDKGNPVYRMLDRRLGALRFLHHANDVGQNGFLSHLFCAETEGLALCFLLLRTGDFF